MELLVLLQVVILLAVVVVEYFPQELLVDLVVLVVVEQVDGDHHLYLEVLPERQIPVGVVVVLEETLQQSQEQTVVPELSSLGILSK
jgi:hypothetical protein